MIEIKVAARDSKLSRMQVQEVLCEFKAFYPTAVFLPHFVKTVGDLDHKMSLLLLGKTDFFTKEVDALVVQGICDVGIHSAKDLPEPLAEGLCLYAITQGVDPSDSLVFQAEQDIHLLPFQARVGISSSRRIEMLRSLRQDLVPVDIRGTIEQRLALVEKGTLEAVIIAEAALIRLGLTFLPRYVFPDKTAPLQGKLAVVGRTDNKHLKKIFQKLDAR
ncbi:MAG: hydroxymethylbilane synthase [Chlamydiae bacterium]|nr:hydroxymethylbilane synthase [Chlamydiota bacterium]